MVGRLWVHSGARRNLPILRFGHIAMMPTEDLAAPQSERGERLEGLGPQEAFIVEMKSIGGFSGAPVFVIRDAPRFDCRILGIDYAHMSGPWEMQLADGTWDVVKDSENVGFAGVIPAWKIRTFLMTDERLKQDQEAVGKMIRDQRKQEGQRGTEKSGIVADAKRPTRKPGPDPETLAADGTMEDVAKRVMDAGKPDASEEPED
jgi:hypothetical protein